jgi:gliding motility-associated-like protein
VVNASHSDYAYLSSLLGILNQSALDVKFPQSGMAGDALTVILQTPGQTLGVGLLTQTTVKFYDSLNTLVKTINDPNALQLKLLTDSSKTYALRIFTSPTDTFKYKRVRLEMTNLLSLNLGAQLRVYDFFHEPHCAPIFATSVADSGSCVPPALLCAGVREPYKAADAATTNYATLEQPVNIAGLLGQSFIDLKFTQPGRSGEYVGFTVQQPGTLLDLNLVSGLKIYVYDTDVPGAAAKETILGNNALSVRLIDGVNNKYTVGFVTNPNLNYSIKRIRLEMMSVLSLLQELRVYNGFHYAPVKEIVPVSTNRPLDLCHGSNITLTAGVTGLAYSWSNGSTVIGSAQSVTVNQSGEYTVTVTDSAGCNLSSFPVKVTINNNPVPVIIGDSVLCANTSGRIKLNSVYSSYSWTGGGINDSLVVAAPGVYKVTVKDAIGCTGTDSIIVINHNLNVAASLTAPGCAGGVNGGVSLNATGGSGNYQYNWSGGETTSAITNKKEGLYTVHIKDAVYSCSYNKAYTLAAATDLQTGLATIQTSDCSKADGKVTVNPVGGSGNYSYLWSNGATSTSIANVTAGIYTVAVTDNVKGCTIRDTAVVSSSNTLLNVVALVTPSSSCNAANGAAIVTVAGGSNNYSYLWSNGATTKDLSNVAPGTYYLLVKDNSNNCYASKAVTIDAQFLNANVVATPSACGGNTGTAMVLVVNGSGSYTYSWSGLGTNIAAVNNLAAGIYVLTVTDVVRGCSNQQVVTIGQTGGPAASLQVTQPSCTAPTGSVSINAAAGLQYLWSTGATTANVSGLMPGNYTVTVTDPVAKCSSILPVIVNHVTPVSVTVNPTAYSSCLSNPNGKAIATVTGGTAPFTYSWTGGITTPALNNVIAGNYNLIVADAKGCSINAAVTIPFDTVKVLKATVTTATPAFCNTSSTGALDVSVTGGAQPYTYLWSNGLPVQDLLSVLPGQYTLVVTDLLGCKDTLVATVQFNTANQVDATVALKTEPTCAASFLGAINTSVSGGTAPYSYLWSTGSVLGNLTGLAAGNYTLVVTDVKNCKDTLAVQLKLDTANAVTAAALAVTPTACNTSATGAIDVGVTKGTAPYSYRWSTGALTEDLANLTVGNYTLVVTDAAGCKDTLVTAVLPDPATNVDATLASKTEPTCAASVMGAIATNVTGGTTPYTYSWSTGATTPGLTGVGAGTYSVVVSDVKNCKDTLSVQVNINSANNVTATAGTTQAATCNVAANGAVDVNIAKGTAPYTYSWSNGAATQDLDHVKPGTYTLVVTDAAGCKDTLGANIIVDTARTVRAVLDSIVSVKCSDLGSGAVFAHADRGTAPYAYSWSNGATTQNLTGVTTGSYTLTVTDADGCSNQLNAVVDKVSNMVVVATAVPVACYGGTNGAASVQVNGGSGNYGYTWSNGSISAGLSAVAAGAYSVQVLDNQTGCAGADTVTVSQPDALVLTGAVTNDTCYSTNDGAVNLEVAGGVTPYTFRWSNNAETQSIIGLKAGTYAVTVTDHNACTAQQTFVVKDADCDFKLVIHDVITPNGDGANDFFVIDGIQFYSDNSVKVFSKWGDEVFASKGYQNNWNGQGKSGSDLPAGTYYYVLDLGTAAVNGQKVFTGYLMLHR